MKEIKKKKCRAEGCKNEFTPRLSTDKFCSVACHISSMSKKLTAPKKQVKIKNVSSKKLKDLAKYRPLRDEYLANNPVCEVRGCSNDTTNLHHKAGRAGVLLYDVRYFMACCSSCHPNKIHHEANDSWARKEGYIITINLN